VFSKCMMSVYSIQTAFVLFAAPAWGGGGVVGSPIFILTKFRIAYLGLFCLPFEYEK
jgi:hypothetical protein